jgi:CheY-like chemotaxis protein
MISSHMREKARAAGLRVHVHGQRDTHPVARLALSGTTGLCAYAAESASCSTVSAHSLLLSCCFFCPLCARLCTRDASMDLMDGLEASRLIRQQMSERQSSSGGGAVDPARQNGSSDRSHALLPPTPVQLTQPYIIAQTAHASDDYRQKCLQAGMSVQHAVRGNELACLHAKGASLTVHCCLLARALSRDAFLSKPIALDALVGMLKDAFNTLQAKERAQPFAN